MIASTEKPAATISALPHLAVLCSPSTNCLLKLYLSPYSALQYLCKLVLALSLALRLGLFMANSDHICCARELPAEDKFSRCRCCNATEDCASWKRLSTTSGRPFTDFCKVPGDSSSYHPSAVLGIADEMTPASSAQRKSAVALGRWQFLDGYSMQTQSC